MTTTVMLSGGGTGGHIFPALALREELLRRHPGWNFVFVGTRRGLETQIVPRHGVTLEFIDIEGLIGRGLRSLRALMKLPGAIASAKKLLKKYSPGLVAGFGGYASFPLLWAASGMNIPTLIHESNLVPGFANRRLAGRVTARASAFAVTRHTWPDTVVTGMPVRAAFAAAGARRLARPGEMRVLIAGGSRGAAGLNRMVETDLDALLKIPGIRIRHQTGAAQFEKFSALYRENNLVSPEPFIADMAEAMGAADLFVGRAGASTLAENTVAGLPAVLIPCPAAAGDHQVKNAGGLAGLGAAQVLEEKEFHPGALAEKISALRKQPEMLQKMAAAASQAATPDAAAKLADLAEKIMGAAS